MAKPIPAPSYDNLLEVVGQFPAGAGLDQIEARLVAAPTRRTLQRWVNDLLAQGRLHKEGRGRATRYLRAGAVAASNPASRQTNAATQAQILIPLSDTAQAIEAHVRQPIALRTRLPPGFFGRLPAQRQFLPACRHTGGITRPWSGCDHP